MSPKTLVEEWVAAFNNRDVDLLVRFYEDEAINYQVPEIEVRGKPAIRKMFENAFETAEMVCMIENIFEDGDWAILEWRDPLGLRGCGFFQTRNGKIRFQRGYWDKLSFLKVHDLPIPQ
ncbi:MAG: nuclear transport factor 2 family protein [Acidiferrobacterales bacterium]|nr:nuclear transport factor 2 family protein [Acidiferrobacterales bacterium]